jgi:hypothetical protein
VLDTLAAGWPTAKLRRGGSGPFADVVDMKHVAVTAHHSVAATCDDAFDDYKCRFLLN